MSDRTFPKTTVVITIDIQSVDRCEHRLHYLKDAAQRLLEDHLKYMSVLYEGDTGHFSTPDADVRWRVYHEDKEDPVFTAKSELLRRFAVDRGIPINEMKMIGSTDSSATSGEVPRPLLERFQPSELDPRPSTSWERLERIYVQDFIREHARKDLTAEMLITHIGDTLAMDRGGAEGASYGLQIFERALTHLANAPLFEEESSVDYYFETRAINCRACGKYVCLGENEAKHETCWHCGAKMKGGEEK